jgi:hypothetical protein
MVRRGLAAGALLVVALCQSTLLPDALGGSQLATLLAWGVLFGGLGAAVALVILGNGPAWSGAGLLALLMLDASLIAQLVGLPGKAQRPWDTPAVVALAAETVVLLLWLSVGIGGLLLRATAVAAAGLVAVALMPLGTGPAPTSTPAALSTHLGHAHAGTSAAAPTPTAPDVGAPLEQQLAAARAAAAQYPTLADALAAGWTQADDYIAGIGSHYMSYGRIDSIFDPAKPEMLLFSGDQPDSHIVGVTYYVVHQPPTGFTGDQDVWHQHQNICIAADGPRFAGDGASGCKARWDWSWMLHAWVVPGYENPDGVFATENPLV